MFVVCQEEVPTEIGYLEPLEGKYRKPNFGMIQYVLVGIEDEGKTVDQAWMIGDRTEDEQSAINAGINFCPADVWRDRFRTGVFTHAVTPAQLQFLEAKNLDSVNQQLN
ncbi:MAG: HAD hydrolase-like protein [Nostoc sp. NMS7]|uniref:HAD hydrolase-like protein n=1 Tax=Nostoc sp. NMS7 TaxID=2815391 RepID=UPI0025E5ECF5|nr:HAD hydrolase-like protein [Nostoc sp. NMS7]MBN3948383.1 HAD hydrolase-like protein [Nostoc sp. NMS7]